MAAVFAETQKRIQTLLDSHREKYLQQYKDLFAKSDLFEDSDPNSYEERTYVDEEGRTVRTRVRKQQHSVQVRSQTRIVNGKAVKTQTRAYLQYQGPEGGYSLKMADGDDDMDMREGRGLKESESEDEVGGGDEVDGALLPRSRSSKCPGSILSEISEDARTAIVDLDPDALQSRPAKGASRLEKAWLAAKELVDTEERYVAKLGLLDQEFRVRVDKEKDKCGLNRDRYSKLFSNVASIYQFHNSHFLPPLLERRRDWQVSSLPG